MGHMLGVEDRYNMCLLPLASVVVVCQAMIRYIFLPLIQLETPQFRRMVEALLIGLSHIMPHMTYDIQMFTVKRVLGVPGYQYGVDLTKEKMCPQLFTQNEADDLRDQIFRNTGVEYREFTFSTSIPIVRIRNHHNVSKDFMDTNGNMLTARYPSSHYNFLEVDNECYLEITFADPDSDSWKTQLNDSQFYKLSRRERTVIKTRILLKKLFKYQILRFIFECVLSLTLYFMRM